MFGRGAGTGRRRGGAWARFLGDRGGAVAIEFAFVGGLTIELVLEAFQGGLFLYQQASLERAAGIAARQVMVWAATSSSMTQAQFISQVVCPALPAGMNCANVTVDSEVVSEDASPGGFYAFARSDLSGLVAMPSKGAATFCTGASGAVVYMRFSYQAVPIAPAWRAWANAMGMTLNGVPAYRVTSYEAFRNEPFQGSGSSC